MPIANHQQQVADASAVFIILGDLEANKMLEVVYRPLIDAGLMPVPTYEAIINDVNQVYERPQAKIRDDALINASLFAMQLMLAAKAKGYDTGPMGGFQPDQLKDFLRIPDRFVPVMLVTAGIERRPAYATNRLPLNEIVMYEPFKE